MQQSNPWDNDAVVPAGGGMIVTKPVTTKDAAETTSAAQRAADAVAAAPYRAQSAADDFQIKHSQAIDAKAKSDSVEAMAKMATMAPTSGVHGEAYLKQFVPPQMQEMVRAYARGDLGSRAGGMSTSMLPIIQHAMNYDPSVSATTFPARAKMQQDLAGNQPNTLGGGLRAMEQMLFHGRDVLRNGAALNNYGPGIAGSIGNKLKTGYESLSDDPRLAAYNQSINNYAPESQKGVAGAAGIGAEREERHAAYSPTLSQASRAASLQADATMAFDRTGAVNDQYKRLMGKDIVDLLSPEAKKAYDEIMSGGHDASGKPLHPAPGYVPGSAMGGTPPPAAPSGGAPAGFGIGSGPGGMSIDPSKQAAASKIEGMLADRSIPDDQIRAFATAAGASPDSVDANLAFRKSNPGYKGGYNASAIGMMPKPQTTFSLNGGTSPFGTAMMNAAGALTGNTLDNMTADPALARAGLAGASAANPGSAAFGNVLGTGLGAVGTELGIGAAAGKAGLQASPWVARGADGLFGGLSGAGAADDGGRLGGAAEGAALGVGGGMVGRGVVAPALTGMFGGGTRAIARAFGKEGFATPPSALSAGDAAVLGTARKSGIDGITNQLTEAQRLGLPMGLVDTSPAMTSLGGAAVRRSPTAAEIAQNALLPRARGQIDRLGSAVARDLGPIGNIPQISADMTQQARAAAGPLYDRAYANPVISTPELDATLNTPFGRDALGRARTIAANERRSPTEMGFGQDAQGNTILNPMPNRAIADHLSARDELDAAQEAYRAAKTQPGSMDNARTRLERARENVRQTQTALAQAPDPTQAASVPGYTTQTLDYVKRGMDDVLEQQRNPITGRLQLDEAGRAQNQVKNQFLGEVDRINPAYRDARNAYAGPVQARDAMARGQDAFSLNPNELGMQVAGQSPEHLGQMQLGYRSALMDKANAARFSTNPFDATLGTPAAEQRLSTLYPDSPGVPNLLRQRDLEGQMSRTNNAVLGNSMTAQRQIADDTFAGSPLLEAGLHAGAAFATGGASVPGTAARIAGIGLKDRIALGLGSRAVAKADAIAPSLFNTNPEESLALVRSLMTNDDAYRSYINNLPSRRIGGMFGAGLGAAAGSSLIAPVGP